MNSLVKRFALLVAVTCAVWVAVLWRWQSTARDMSSHDIVVYLGLLPLTVFGFVLLLGWAWRSAEARQTIAAAQPAAATSVASNRANGSGEQLVSDEANRRATVQLLGARVVCAAGESPASLLKAAGAGQPRPAVDSEFVDATGLPVFTARIADLDLEGFSSSAEPWIQAAKNKRAEWVRVTPRHHVARALAALRAPLAETVADLGPWSHRFRKDAGDGRGRVEPSEIRVRVLLGWPADWNAFEQEWAAAVANAWLTAEADADSGIPIPASSFALTSYACSGEDLMLHADRLLQTLAREDRGDAVIVAACHSSIGDEAIESLEQQGLLFSASSRPHGRMPGEAAAVLLLAGAQWPQSPDSDRPVQHLHRPAVFRRDKSVEAPGRVSGETLRQTIVHAIEASGLPASDLGALCCDADQHSARSGEFFGGGRSLMTHLDHDEDLRLLGTVTGSVGAVGALLVLACAAETARVTDKPSLAVTLGDPIARLALIALPTKPAAPEAASKADPSVHTA